MNEFSADFPLHGRLARAVESARDEAPPALPMERALSRARALEPRESKPSANDKGGLWRNRISSLFDQLEDRDLLTAVPLCCVSPAELPTSTHAVQCASAGARERRASVALLTPASFSVAGDVWEEALTGLWSEEEELAVGTGGADWIATSTACADWTWPG